MYVVRLPPGGGIDGGAIEIDDGRNHKDNFHIHHNTTINNGGFLEISWMYDIAQMPNSNIVIEYNVSNDYQDLVLWWAEASDGVIRNNTIIRTRDVGQGGLESVFHCLPAIDFVGLEITQNIVVFNNDFAQPVFAGDATAISQVNHNNNCYWEINGETIDLGVDMGPGEFQADPLFVNYSGGDYHLQPGSPCAGWGAFPSPEK
jgi:hypothetical protein